MGSGVDAAGEPAHDRIASAGQAACELLSHAEAVGSRMPGADDGHGERVCWPHFTADK